MNDFLSGTIDTEVGTAVEVSSELKVSEETKYAIKDGAQALKVCESLQSDAEQIIQNAATITHVLNGQRPNDPNALKQAGRSWFPNTSSRFLKNQCSAIPARIFMPVLTATYLTAAELPAGWPLGTFKSSIFRDLVTKMIRAWPSWQWFMKGLAHEAATLGYGFAVYFDEWDWRPTFISCTRGFVPIGTQITDEDGPPLFAVRWDYRVDQLLEIVEEAKSGGRKNDWLTKNVEAAVNAAQPKSKDATESNAREYAEMVRDSTIGESYEKAYRVISTWHLFSTDPDGKVSHHIVLAEDAGTKTSNQPLSTKETLRDNDRLLFERRGHFDSMNDVVNPLLFDPETGTIHGSWGAAQHIFDIAQEYERRACDWASSLVMSAKAKVQVKDGVNPDEVRLQVDDLLATLSNAIYAGNVAAIPADARPFQDLLEFYRASAGEIIGNYIPPIPLEASDIKAAQIDAKVKEQQERREQTFVMLLGQIAKIIGAIVRRATKDGTPDEVAKKLIKAMKDAGLTDEEIRLLADQPPISTIFEFTELAIAKQAAFAATKSGNPFYNQAQLERVQAEAAGGRAFAQAVLLPGDDATTERTARRQQQIETAAMLAGEVIEALPPDNDWWHMQELRPKVEAAIMDMHPAAANMLTHYSAHFVGAINKKGFPKGYSGNLEKAFILKASEALRTGQMPPEGFADQPDIIGQIEQAMQQQPVLSGPTATPALGANNASASGLEQLVNGGAN